MGLDASAGRVSPRRATYFLLLRQKKVGKEKATLPAASLRFATGNLRCSRAGCRRGTHCALRASFKQPRRVRARSGRVLRRTRAPRPLRSSAHPEGRFVRAIAALGPDRNTGPSAAMARMDFHPLWLRLRHSACGVTRAPQDARVRGLTRGGCPSAVNAVNAASSTAHPASAATQVCPGAQRRGRRLGVAFSLPTFFWRSKRK